MTLEELKKLVYAAFYSVARILELPSREDFEAMTVAETWEDIPPDPPGWGDFWWEVLALKIQSNVMAEQERIKDFDTGLLKNNKDKTWAEVIELIGSRLTGL